MASIALITESDFDIEALAVLAKRLHTGNLVPVGRPCNGSVRGRFLKRLQELQYSYPQLNKALVVSDAHGKSATVWRQTLQQQAGSQVYPFPVEYVVLVQELEALLLCDPRAIESVCASHGKIITLPNLTHSPEGLPDAKTELLRQLSQGGVVYTKVVAGEIASRADLASLDYWSPSFRRFRAALP